MAGPRRPTSDELALWHEAVHGPARADAKKPGNDSATFSIPPSPELPIELPKNIVNGNIEPISSETNENIPSPEWLNNKGYQLLTETAATEKPFRESLFPGLTHRGILGAVLTVQKIGQDINMNALIRQVVKGRIPKTLPKNINGTLGSGCQLLLDYNDSMVPFWEDLSALAGQIENLIGSERVKIYEFDKDPTSARHWTPPNRVKTWQPEPGRPIIVATNLNITGPRKQPDVKPFWHTFIKQCQQLHIPVVLLIPWQERYWPEDLGNHPILVHWNPATTAAMIHNLVGKGHKVNQ